MKYAVKTSMLVIVSFFVFVLASGVSAAELAAPLKPLAFLVGRWDGGGVVADTGGTAKGFSTITVEANGGVLLRKDHTALFDKAGKLTGGFDQVMMIYPDAGGVRADYSDGQHLIHYTSARVEPGRSVEFIGDARPGAPTFRLRYEIEGPDVLTVTFGVVPPGQTTFQPIATGELHRAK